jgi:hypothetical protein
VYLWDIEGQGEDPGHAPITVSPDEILLLNAGKVDAQGDYTALLKTGINFAQSLRSDDTQNHDSEKQFDKRMYFFICSSMVTKTLIPHGNNYLI